MNLFMIMLGCKPKGRYIEQHDIYFGIGDSLKSFVSALENYWAEGKDGLHIDAWREVHAVDDYRISVSNELIDNDGLKLYFVNLGGYKRNDIEEYHYKEIVVAKDIEEAKTIAKNTVFFKNHLSPHVDDKYGIDVDDIYEIEDMLTKDSKNSFHIKIEKLQTPLKKDKVTNGYYLLETLK